MQGSFYYAKFYYRHRVRVLGSEWLEDGRRVGEKMGMANDLKSYKHG